MAKLQGEEHDRVVFLSTPRQHKRFCDYSYRRDPIRAAGKSKQSHLDLGNFQFG